MSTRTTVSLATLMAAPLVALVGVAGAQSTSPLAVSTGDATPLPMPNQYAFTSVAVHSDVDLAQIPGVDILLEPEGGTPLLATTGTLGATEFYQFRNGTVVDATLQETPIDGGVALGAKTRFQVQVGGKGILSYSKQLTQPTAHSIVVDDDGASEQRVFPEGRDFPFWDINVVPKSGVKFDADVGMLVNGDVVEQVLDYYGYPYDSTGYTRGLFMRVNTPGGATLGEDGVGLVMHNFGERDYNTQQLDVVHFSADADPVPVDAARDAAPLVSEFMVSYKYLDSEPHALYYLGGEMPEGYTFFLWRDGKESDYSDVLSVPLDTPTFEGSKDQGIDLVDLSGEVPVYSANGCSDCTPPGVTNDPDWQCTPPGVSGWTKFWWFGCPGDGDKVGGIECQQWYIPVTPIFCNSDGNIQLCVKRSATFSVKIGVDGGEIGSSVTIEKSTCLTADIEPGDNGCGECVRMWGVGLICTQEYSNHDDVTCNEGGYCFGHTWTKDCYEYDPVFTKCTDTKVTVTRCSRG